MLKKIASSLAFLLFVTGVGLFTTSTPVQATSSTASPLLSKACFQTFIQLNGSQPATSQCLIAGQIVSGKMSPVHQSGEHPNTYTTACILGSAEIDSNANGVVCFAGIGNLNISLSGVYRVNGYYGWAGAPGRVRYNGNDFYFQAWSSYGCRPFCGNGTNISQVELYIG